MTLNAVADCIAKARPDDYYENKLRCGLSNLATGFDLGHISKVALKRRTDWLVDFFFGQAPPHDRNILWAGLTGTLDAFGEDDHYERQEALTEFLDCRAITFASDVLGEAGEWWLGRRADAKKIAAEFLKGACMGTVGAPKKALWLTPYRGEIEELCERAKQAGTPDSERNRILRRIVEKLGLVHLKPGEGVVGFITTETLGQLRYSMNGTDGLLPVGSTAIEARNHPRFRPWPRPKTTDAYGRTYDLNPGFRANAPLRYHGAAEATRPGMPMEAFEQCIFLGTIAVDPHDADEQAYIDEIAANHDSVALLRKIAEMVA